MEALGMNSPANPMTGAAFAQRRFVGDESAVTAIEYALLATLLVLSVIGAYTAASDSVVRLFEYVSTTVSAAL